MEAALLHCLCQINSPHVHSSVSSGEDEVGGAGGGVLCTLNISKRCYALPIRHAGTPHLIKAPKNAIKQEHKNPHIRIYRQMGDML